MIDVSVIVPVYKVEPYIRASLDSMLQQTHQNIEIILVDDGSPDRSGEICDEYAAKDARVRVIHKQNEGTGMARNTGMDAACGEYLYFSDPDDLMEPTLIEDNLRLARRHDADVVAFGFKRRMNGREETFVPALSGEYSYEAFWDAFPKANELMSSLWLRLFRKSFIDKNGLRAQTLSTAQDAYFLFDTYGARFNKVVFNPKPYYIYLIRPSSAVTAYKPERFENQYKVTQRFEEVLRDTPEAGGRYQQLVDQRYIVSFLVAFKTLAHAKEIPFGEKRRIAREYALRAPIHGAIRRMSIASAGPFTRKLRVLMMKGRMFGLLLWLDGRGGGIT